jgi:hypothetical protein
LVGPKRKEKDLPISPNLACCASLRLRSGHAFARVICFRFGNSKTRQISNMLGYIYLNTMARKYGRFKLAETSQNNGTRSHGSLGQTDVSSPR